MIDVLYYIKLLVLVRLKAKKDRGIPERKNQPKPNISSRKKSDFADEVKTNGNTIHNIEP